MASKLLLRAKGNNIDVEVEVEAWKPLVLVGLNASLKSATARTFTALCKEKTIGPTLEDYGAKCEIKLGDGDDDCEHWLYSVVEDARVSLRSFLSQQKLVDRIHDDIEGLLDVAPKEITEYVEAVRDEINSFISRLLFGFVMSYAELKKLSNLGVLRNMLQVLEDNISEVVKSFKKIYGDKAGEVTPENLLPLDVEVILPKSRREDVYKIQVFDKRLNIHLDSRLASSSIASMLLFKYVALFLSVTSYTHKLLVIEEPEEALAPLQQVLFARYLEGALEVAEKLAPYCKVFVVITTHSPYMALGLRRATHYYMKYVDNVFKAERGVPHRPFSLGDLALLEALRRVEEAEGAPSE